MKGRTWFKVAPPIFVLLALFGAWISHTLLFLSLGKGQAISSLSPSPFGSVHQYMLPLFAILLGCSLLLAKRLWSLWWRVVGQLEQIRLVLRTTLRGGSSGSLPLRQTSQYSWSVGIRFFALWCPLLLTQLILYAIQENLEARALHQIMPGLAVFTGSHCAAGVIHAEVAGLLTVAILILLRVFGNVKETIQRLGKIIRNLIIQRRISLQLNRFKVFYVFNHVDYFGSNLWCRPPPISLICQ